MAEYIIKPGRSLGIFHVTCFLSWKRGRESWKSNVQLPLLYIFRRGSLNSLEFGYYTWFMRFCVFFSFSSIICDSLFFSSWDSCPESQSVVLYSFQLPRKRKIHFYLLLKICRIFTHSGFKKKKKSSQFSSSYENDVFINQDDTEQKCCWWFLINMVFNFISWVSQCLFSKISFLTNVFSRPRVRTHSSKIQEWYTPVSEPAGCPLGFSVWKYMEMLKDPTLILQ